MTTTPFKAKAKKPKQPASLPDMELLGEQIKALFQFCGSLIAHKDKIQKAATGLAERGSTIMAMAPILGAVGEDYEVHHFENELRRKRADALHNLLVVLDETEKERKEFHEKQQRNHRAKAQISQMLGLC